MSFNPEVLDERAQSGMRSKKAISPRYYGLVSNAGIPLFGVQKASVYAKLETVALEEHL
jgi:hypothetical protein